MKSGEVKCKKYWKPRRVDLHALPPLLTVQFSSFIVLFVLGLGLSARAAPAPAGDLADQVNALIQQLDDADFQARESAVRQLVKIGPPATEPLEAGMRSDSPEVRVRSARTLREIAAAPAFRVHIAGGVKTVDVREPTRCVHIRRDDTGYSVIIDAVREGRWTRSAVHADTHEKLSANLEAYEAYVRFGGGPGKTWAYLDLLPSGDFELSEALDDANPTSMGRFIDRLFSQMRQSRTPAADQQRVLGEIEQMLVLRANDPNPSAARADALEADYLRRSDALREELAALHLPDPGDVLPVPARFRLGITIYPNPSAEIKGLIVNAAVSDSRGSRIGLRSGDVIHRVDGHTVETADDVRHAMMHAKGPVQIGIDRAGAPLRLSEQPRAKTASQKTEAHVEKP